MLLRKKVQMMVTFMNLQEDVRILQKSPFAPKGLCILPSFSCRGASMFPFPSSLYLLMGMEAELTCEQAQPMHCWRWAWTPMCSTHPDSPQSEQGHRLVQPTLTRVPSAQPCQGCTLLLQHRASLSLAVADFFSCVQFICAFESMVKGTLEAWPRTSFEDPSYVCCLLFLQPLSWHTMYLLVCKRVCPFLVLM